MRRMGVVCSLK